MSTPATLLVQQGDDLVEEVILETECLVLGRGADCQVVLPGHLISRRHACIRRVDQQYLIEDLGSRNGTTVNDQPLTCPRVLHDGDRIEIGGLRRMVFVDTDATSTRPRPPASGIWLDQAAQDVWVDGQLLDPQVSPAQFCLLQLLLARMDQVCSRADIVSAVWPNAIDGVSEEAIDGLVKRVRARLAEIHGGDRYIHAVRGRGLMLRSSEHARRS